MPCSPRRAGNPMGSYAIGMRGRYEATVEPRHCGPENGYPDFFFLSDPWFTLFCEIACDEAMKPGYGPGEASVGVRLDLERLAPVPAGRRVRLEARVAALDGRRLRFEVVGEDAGRAFVRGTHDRVAVDLERFLARLPTAG